jgi:hypothetical protein
LLLDQEDFDELSEFAFERVEHSKDRVDVFLEEVKVRVVAHLVVACVFFELVVLSSVEADALLEDLDQVFDRRVLPEIAAVLRIFVDEDLAACNHLVG